MDGVTMIEQPYGRCDMNLMPGSGGWVASPNALVRFMDQMLEVENGGLSAPRLTELITSHEYIQHDTPLDPSNTANVTPGWGYDPDENRVPV
jgi:hypothetical protein